MNDEQCSVIVEAIKDLTRAVNEVAQNVDNIWCYSDSELRKEVHLIAEVIEDIACKL